MDQWAGAIGLVRQYLLPSPRWKLSHLQLHLQAKYSLAISMAPQVVYFYVVHPLGW
jgi:hypothetical protein